MVRFIGLPKFTGGPIGRKGGAGGVTAKVKILGIPKAVAKLRGAESVVRLDLGLLTRGGAEHMENLAKDYVGVATGNLKSGIYSERVASYSWMVIASSEEGDDPKYLGKNTYEYAPFVEFGTKYMQGQFFMTRAYNETKPLVLLELNALARKLERL